MPPKIDLPGQTLGDRVVLQQVDRPGRQAHWLTRCKCGQESVVYYQKPHGGMDLVAEALDSFNISYLRRNHPTRNLEELEIRKSCLTLFRACVQPRYPKKAARLAEETPV